MDKFITLLLSLCLFKGEQKHKFEIKFYDVYGSCVKTVSASGIEKIGWTGQCYTISKRENIEKISIYNGAVAFYFDDSMLVRVRTFDMLSSFAYPKDVPLILTNNGRVYDSGEFCMLQQGESEEFQEIAANKSLIAYLKKQGVVIE